MSNETKMPPPDELLEALISRGADGVMREDLADMARRMAAELLEARPITKAIARLAERMREDSELRLSLSTGVVYGLKGPGGIIAEIDTPETCATDHGKTVAEAIIAVSDEFDARSDEPKR